MPKQVKKATVPLNTSLEQMLISAVRYACGRRTYIVSDTVSYIRDLIPQLSDWCISVLIRDFEANIEMEGRVPEHSGMIWGAEQDRKQWMSLFADLKSETLKRNEVNLL